MSNVNWSESFLKKESFIDPAIKKVIKKLIGQVLLKKKKNFFQTLHL